MSWKDASCLAVSLVAIAGCWELAVDEPSARSQALNGDCPYPDLPAAGCDRVIDGDVQVSSVADLNALAGVHEIRGELSIQGASVADLSPLGCLRSVESLHLRRNESLQTLAGLENLIRLPELVVADNPRLVDVEGLCRVSGPMTGGLAVSNNRDLEQLDGLEGVSSVSLGISVRDNASLRDTAGLAGIQHVDASIVVRNNARLERLELPRLETLRGSLWIQDNPALRSIWGLRKLSAVGREVVVTNNAALTHLDGLGSLEVVPFLLRIEDNPALVSVEGLSGLRRGFYILIRNNDALWSLRGLDNLRIAEEALDISGNDRLETMKGLGGLGYVGELFQIAGNGNLRTLDGLHSFGSVGTTFAVIGNDALVSLDGLCSFEGSSRGSVRIERNNALASLDGLESLVSAFWVSIRDNPVLPSCAAVRLAERIRAADVHDPPGFTISGNDDTATCD